MKTTPLGILGAALLSVSAPHANAAKVSVSFFYDALEPYGDWVETSDYGYVWHPRDVDENWRPYTAGNWAYTDAGWTWVSEEPYGWATYHYGRWADLDREGWVWVPDTDWAPAWVSWRDNDRYVGWAPLPPEAKFKAKVGFQGWVDSYYDIGPAAYSFVAVRDLGAPRLRDVIVQPRENITIISETKNITRITSDRNVIVDEGPRFEAVSRLTAQPIRHLRLDREVNVDTSLRAGRADRFAAQVNGDSLRVVAPEIEVSRDAVPKRVAQRLEQVQVNRGWSNAGDPQQVQQLRQRLATEEKAPAGLPPRANLRGARATEGTAGNTRNEAEPANRNANAPNGQPGSDVASNPGFRSSRAIAPGREASTPEPGTPAANDGSPDNRTQPRRPEGRRSENSRAAEPGDANQRREPGARAGRTSEGARTPDAEQPESRREGTTAQPGNKPDSPDRPSKAEPSERRPGEKSSRPETDKATDPEAKQPPIAEGPGRRAGKTDPSDTNEPKERTSKERKNSGDDSTTENAKKSPANQSDEPRPGARLPRAGNEERSNTANEEKSGKADEKERPKAQPKEDSEDEGAKRKTPAPKADRSERTPAEKPEGQPAAEKRKDPAATGRKEVPKGAEKRDKDRDKD